MGSFFIVKAPIVLPDDAGFGDGKEDFLVQAFVAKTAMKTFNESPRASKAPNWPRYPLTYVWLLRLALLIRWLSYARL